MKLRQTLFLCLILPGLLLSMSAPVAKDDKPGKAVMEFLNWYKSNHERLNKMNMVINYVNGTGPTGKNYQVDYKGVEKYLTELKKSGRIGPKYVEKARNYFKKCDADFAANPQNSGPPKGFDFDLVMHAQDFDSELANLDKAEIKSEIIESNSYALVMIKFTSGRVIKYELAKQNNQWLINDISI
jgi:hypothetical protein